MTVSPFWSASPGHTSNKGYFTQLFCISISLQP